MALRFSFNKTDDTLAMLNRYLMQNKLSEMSNQRYMNTLSEQDRLMRERMAEEDVLMTRRQQSGHEQRVKEAFYKFQQDIAQMDPIARLTTLEQFVQEPEAQKQFKRQKEAAMMEMLPVWTKVSKGEQLDNNDLMALQKYIPTDKIQTTINEWGQNIRFFKELPIKQGELGVRQGELGVRQREVSLKEKDQTSGGAKRGEYYNIWHDKIEGAKQYLSSKASELGADGDELTGDMKSDIARLIASKGNETTPQILGKVLTKLNQYDTKASKGMLTPEEEAWIDRAYDIMGVKKEFAPQEISLGGNVGQVLGKAPAPAGQSAHAIGERKPKTFDNGSQALYEWDGSRWIFVKAL